MHLGTLQGGVVLTCSGCLFSVRQGSRSTRPQCNVLHRQRPWKRLQKLLKQVLWKLPLRQRKRASARLGCSDGGFMSRHIV